MTVYLASLRAIDERIVPARIGVKIAEKPGGTPVRLREWHVGSQAFVPSIRRGGLCPYETKGKGCQPSRSNGDREAKCAKGGRYCAGDGECIEERSPAVASGAQKARFDCVARPQETRERQNHARLRSG